MGAPFQRGEIIAARITPLLSPPGLPESLFLLAATPRGLCALAPLHPERGENDAARVLAEEFPEIAPARILPPAATPEGAAHLDSAEKWLARPSQSARPSLDLRGSSFQLAVWRRLQDIPPGQTLSYSALAAALGRPAAARAVASACAANRIALAVPCHRAIGSDSRPCGYRWGVALKLALLRAERRSPLEFHENRTER